MTCQLFKSIVSPLASDIQSLKTVQSINTVDKTLKLYEQWTAFDILIFLDFFFLET